MSGTTTTRPAGIGGIDLSAIDLEWAIFEATGGGFGTPREGTASEHLAGPTKTSDWVTNGGRAPGVTDPAKDADPDALPDPNRDIALTEDVPPPDNPLLDLMKEEPTPHLANGGPEGNQDGGAMLGIVVIIAAVAIIYAVYKAAEHLGGLDTAGDKSATPDEPKKPGLQNWNDTHNPDGTPKEYSDPDASSGDRIDDGALLKSILTGLLGIEDVGAIASDPATFGKAVGAVIEGMMNGKVAELGKLLDRLDGVEGDGAGALLGEGGAMLFAALGLPEELATPLFTFGLEDPSVLAKSDAILGIVVDDGQQQELLLAVHDIWW